jgi:hypothetical protein
MQENKKRKMGREVNGIYFNRIKKLRNLIWRIMPRFYHGLRTIRIWNYFIQK